MFPGRIDSKSRNAGYRRRHCAGKLTAPFGASSIAPMSIAQRIVYRVAMHDGHALPGGRCVRGPIEAILITEG